MAVGKPERIRVEPFKTFKLANRVNDKTLRRNKKI
jgi:hypothetical protein